MKMSLKGCQIIVVASSKKGFRKKSVRARDSK